MTKIAPSVLGADFAHLADEIASAESAGISIYHLDIMDGHFVPNLSFGPRMVKTVDRLTDKFLDVHLMLSEPERYFEPFLKAGADNITFHIEVHPNPVGHAETLHALGVQAGISLNPDKAIDAVLPYLEQFEYLLVMSVFPGFGGQKFIESVMPKIRAAREFIDSHGLKTLIEVDGGIEANNAADLIAAGADVLVMGTGFFGVKDRNGLVKKIEGAATAPGRGL